MKKEFWIGFEKQATGKDKALLEIKKAPLKGLSTPKKLALVGLGLGGSALGGALYKRHNDKHRVDIEKKS